MEEEVKEEVEEEVEVVKEQRPMSLNKRLNVFTHKEGRIWKIGDYSTI